MTRRHSGPSFLILLLAVFITLVPSPGCTDPAPASTAAEALAGLLDKDKVTILITDSGLGGLSITAELERRLQSCHPFSEITLVFANALPSNDHPYNAMPSMEARAATFSTALDGFVQKYHPDLILIACNTLSVVYPETAFSHRTQVPVLGIVDIGAGLIEQTLTADTAATAIIMGTPTTAGSGVHKDRLVKRGIEGNRVVSQACDMLESEIQADPGSDVVAAMIEMYALEALEQVDRSDSGNLTVALCCTHYAYARDTFERVFGGLVGGEVTVVDPNTAMARTLLDNMPCERFENALISVEVVSRAALGDDDVRAIAGILAGESAATAEALRAYHYDTTLFSY